MKEMESNTKNKAAVQDQTPDSPVQTALTAPQANQAISLDAKPGQAFILNYQRIMQSTTYPSNLNDAQREQLKDFVAPGKMGRPPSYGQYS